MLRILKTGCFAILCVYLSACSTIVADKIAGQNSYDYSWFITAEKLQEKGFVKERYCSEVHGLCLSYFKARPLTDQAEMDFSRLINGDFIRLQLNRSEVPKFRGTMVLLHGFKISKEYMAMTALYFRFLGFNVIVPDMLGHGESQGEIAFGLTDSLILDELLNQQRGVEQPLFIFGNSMGAIAASYLASTRQDVDGVILQAPMLVFDTAAFNYIKYDSPMLATVVTERSIRKGALKALRNVNVSLPQTDIKPILSSLDEPVLILASPDDTVAPFAYFESLASSRISVAEIKNRNHYSMVVVSQEDSERIIHWLQKNTEARDNVDGSTKKFSPLIDDQTGR